MKKLLLALTLLLAPSLASAQCNGVFPNNTVCGNVTGANNTPRATSPSAFLGAAGGTNGQIQFNNSSALGGFTASGDATINTATGAVAVTKTGGVPFAPSATTDTTNAANISTGLLGKARGSTGADNSTNTTGDLLVSNGTNGNFVHTAFNALCSLVPSVCNLALGYNNIVWYGAKCDGVFQSSQNFDQPATNISITSGTTLLTSSGSTFSAADVAKVIWVPRAGPAAAGKFSTIASFVNSTQVNIATNASSTVTTFAATNAEPFVYGTDDTTAIQAAMTATSRGNLYIPGHTTGCVIRQQGANAYALLQDHPFSITGDGHYSNLMTFPDIPSTVDNLLVQVGAFDWSGISWRGFSIGASTSFIPSTFLMYPRYGKRGLALVDTAFANFINVSVQNMIIGESGNDFSLYTGNPSSSPSTHVLIAFNEVFGGIKLDNVSDSFRIFNNRLLGASTKGGQFSFVGGAGKFMFVGNNVVWVGGTEIQSGTAPVVRDNYFEEVATATSEANNAMVDFSGSVGTILWPSFTGNIVNAAVSTTSTPVRYANSSGGNFGDNFITTSTARTAVTSVTTLHCPAPNSFNGGGTNFSTSLATPNPFTC